ncbi:hypothetical protein [Mycobacterium noviomagense]|uniref:Anti-sigma-M factor RsmA n=1 Tax=Mycobacterium noviomagense TaxID=459858 RepID=A0A7I7PCT0_9MYCO|nr:hypothetical protein [Mycobacterium noviomagense]ORB13987.1 hypothetical protein BST37_12310 [Mycobacterium noviomagense]BBY06400.1 anti-sigma-M factor RsmA [Mycobacterium noviomagense]
MADADNDPAQDGDEAADPPLTVEQLADLQAGLLDDDEAARVRNQIRADPAAQEALRALNHVRRDLATLGADSQSAPDTPPPVVARITAALRSATDPARPPGAAHALRPHSRPTRKVAAAAGVSAAFAAIGVGTVALLHSPPPTPSAPSTAEHITVSRPPATIPLSAPEILGLLQSRPDYGPLSDPSRRASCLTGLGYSASTEVLGARPVEVSGRAAVLLVLPGNTPDRLTALAVAANCSAADTGLLADTTLARP